jgi:hypothetical protein
MEEERTQKASGESLARNTRKKDEDEDDDDEED